MLQRKVLIIIYIAALFLSPTVYLNPGYADVSVSITEPDTEPTTGIEDVKAVLSDYHKDTDLINRSINMVEDILIAEPRNVEALIFISRLWLTYGYAISTTRQDMIRVFEIGKNYGSRAMGIAPDNPDAHFFYIANMASLGDVKGVLNSLFMLPEIRRELEIILELDPNHVYGLAMQGALYYYLPGILGGDTQVSEIYLKRALFIDPHLSSARLYMAMNLRKQKRYDEALDELILLVRDKEPTFYPDWYLNRKFAISLISVINREKGGKNIRIKHE